MESPKLTYHNNFYYLTVAEGGTAGPSTSHMVVSARSRTPNGPWENSPYNPIIHTEDRRERWWSKGHGSLIETSQGNWYIIYHGYEKDYHTLGKQNLLEQVGRQKMDGSESLQELRLLNQFWRLKEKRSTTERNYRMIFLGLNLDYSGNFLEIMIPFALNSWKIV